MTRPNPNVTQISDRTMMTDVLDTEKFLTVRYNWSANECATASLRRTFLSIHRDEQDLAERFYDIMSRRGWYQVPVAQAQQVQQIQSRWQ